MYNNKIKQKILAKRDMAKFENKLKDFCHSSSIGIGFELFYDQFSGIFFQSTTASVLAAELAINRELQTAGECSVAMFYDMIGVDYSSLSLDQQYYWRIDDETYWVDFDHIFIDSDVYHPPYHLIAMIPEPVYDHGDMSHVI